MKEEEFKRLIDILQDIYQVQKRLYQLGEEKKEAIIAEKIEQLEKITKKEEDLITVTDQLEKKRDEIVDKNKNISKIIDKLAPKQVEQLNHWRNEIFSLIEDLAYLNQRNNKLLENALQLNNFTMNLLTNKQRHSTYGKSGTDNQGEQNSFINHKA